MLIRSTDLTHPHCLVPRTCALARPCRTDEPTEALGTSVAPRIQSGEFGCLRPGLCQARAGRSSSAGETPAPLDPGFRREEDVRFDRFLCGLCDLSGEQLSLLVGLDLQKLGQGISVGRFRPHRCRPVFPLEGRLNPGGSAIVCKTESRPGEDRWVVAHHSLWSATSERMDPAQDPLDTVYAQKVKIALDDLGKRDLHPFVCKNGLESSESGEHPLDTLCLSEPG